MTQPVKKTIATKIRGLRLKNRLTREQMCSIMAISLSDYVDLEEGNVTCTEDRVTDFVNIFGVDRSAIVPRSAVVKHLHLEKDKDRE